MAAELESIVAFADELLGTIGFPDFAGAQNGLQVFGDRPVRRLGAAVDAGVSVIERVVEADIDLLLVHHGLFWEGLRPLTGRRYARVAPLVRSGTALYASHLPLDAHPDIGNASLLAREMGLSVDGRFGVYEGIEIGMACASDLPRERLREALAEAVGGPARLIPGGPEVCVKVGVVTGSGASFLDEAHRQGFDTLVTGEAAHHAYLDAMELGVNLVLGGHYATETFGVRALAASIADRFGLEWEFIDSPTGM